LPVRVRTQTGLEREKMFFLGCDSETVLPTVDSKEPVLFYPTFGTYERSCKVMDGKAYLEVVNL
jgi:hypothetical protein